MNYYLDKEYNNEIYKYRKETDLLFESQGNIKSLGGNILKSVNFVIKHQLLNQELWDTFIEQFSFKDDSLDGGWRGEYFGKMMRGASYVYKVSNNEVLYETLKNACLNLIKLQAENGRLSYTSKFNTLTKSKKNDILLGENLGGFYL